MGQKIQLLTAEPNIDFLSLSNFLDFCFAHLWKGVKELGSKKGVCELYEM